MPEKRSGVSIEMKFEASRQCLSSIGIDRDRLDPVLDRRHRLYRLEVDANRCRPGTVDIVAYRPSGVI